MFGRCADTLFLHAVNVCGGDQAGQHRVFGKIFEIPAVQGVAKNVHARSQYDIISKRDGFLTNIFTDPPGDFLVPGCRSEKAGGEGGRRIHVLANSDRAVHHYYGRNAQTGDRIGDASRSVKVFPFVWWCIESDSYDKMRLLFGCHRFDNIRNIVFGQFWLRAETCSG